MPPRPVAPPDLSAEVTRITEALSGAPASARNGSSRPPQALAGGQAQPPAMHPDLEVTAQHGVIADAMPPSGPEAERTTVAAKPKARPRPNSDETTIAAKPSRADATALVAPADDEEIDDDADDEAREVDPDKAEEVKAIDATLARFSAVHDEIAAEEAARRKKLGWLRGQRKEPELGTDMPFDFTEGREGASRMEWKKRQRRRRLQLIVLAVVVAASLLVFLITGIFLS